MSQGPWTRQAPLWGLLGEGKGLRVRLADGLWVRQGQMTARHPGVSRFLSSFTWLPSSVWAGRGFKDKVIKDANTVAVGRGRGGGVNDCS